MKYGFYILTFLCLIAFSSKSQQLKVKVIELYSAAHGEFLDNKIEHTWQFHYRDNINTTYTKMAAGCIAVDTDADGTPYQYTLNQQIFTINRLPTNFSIKLIGYEDDQGSRCIINDGDELREEGVILNLKLSSLPPGTWSSPEKVTTSNSRYWARIQYYYSFATPSTPVLTENGVPVPDKIFCADDQLRLTTSVNSPNYNGITYEWQYHPLGDESVTYVSNPKYCGDFDWCSGEFGSPPSCCSEPQFIEQRTPNYYSFKTTTDPYVDFNIKSLLNPGLNVDLTFRVIAKAGNFSSTSSATNPYSFSPARPEFEITDIHNSCSEKDDGSIQYKITYSRSKGMKYYIYDKASPEMLPVSSGLVSNGGGTIGNLPSASYILEIRNTTGACSSMQDFSISTWEPITLNDPNVIQITCPEANDGKVTLSVNGGEAGRVITYTVKNNTLGTAEVSNTTGNFTGLTPGTYTATADDGGCSQKVSKAFTIKKPDPVSATVSNTDVACGNAADGKVIITNISGGIEGESKKYDLYILDSDGSIISSKLNHTTTSYTFTSIPDGTWIVKVEDKNRLGCSDFEESVTLEYLPLKFASTDFTHPKCSYENNGTITVSASEGTGSYTYKLFLGSTKLAENNDGGFTGLAQGKYSVEVTNKDYCTDKLIENFELIRPNPISVDAFITTNATCFNDTKGKIELTTSGGTGTLTYQWYKNDHTKLTGKTSRNLTGVVAGKYYVIIRDGNSCSFTSPEYEIKQPSSALSLNYSKTDIRCYGESNGGITPSASGGWGGYSYQYQLTGATTWSSLSASTNLSEGTYNIRVRDAAGCYAKRENIHITAPSGALSATQDPMNITCSGNNDGKINIVPSGGNGANYTNRYFYSIKKGSASYSAYTSGATNYTYSKLSPATYTVKIKDERGCEKVLPSITISQPAVLKLAVSEINHVQCYSHSTGQVVLTASGGNSGYRYKIGSGSYKTSNTFSGLAAGTYTFTVIDSKGCTAVTSATVTEPSSETTISIIGTSKITCNNGSDGSITAKVSGGDNNALQWQKYLSGSWQNISGQTSGSIANLNSGSYRLRVYNTAGGDCDVYSDVTNLTNPTKLKFDRVDVKQITCRGNADATITPFVSGGWNNYKYYYSFDNSTPSIQFTSSTTFGPGNYKIMATDAEGCSMIYGSTITITEPTNPLAATLSTSNYNGKHISCYGASDGSITINASGGNGAPFGNTYFYSIDGVSYKSSNHFSTLSAGSYKFWIKDERGCVITRTTTLTDPEELKLSIADKNRIVCFGENTGYINLSAAGGTKPYSYSINGSAFQENASFFNLIAGNYSVIAKDANGCIDPTSVTIEGPGAPLSITLQKQDIICNNGNNGTLEATVTGGWGDYSYQWQKKGGASYFNISGETSVTIKGLSEGEYRLKVTDLYGCIKYSDPEIFINPLPLQFDDLMVNQVTCKGDNDGKINAQVSGGWGNYQLQYSLDNWATSINFSSTTELEPGEYKVKVVDGKGCVLEYGLPISITEPAAPLTFFADLSDFNVFNISCKGLLDGKIDVKPQGGNGIPFGNTYQYSINGSAFGSTGIFENLNAGTYSITVKDERGCTYSKNIILIEPSAVSASLQRKNYIKCYGDSTGFIEVDASGGVSPYLYKIDDDLYSPNSRFDSLSTASYTLTVKDANGCEDAFEETINQPYDSLSITFATKNISCYDGNDGGIEAVVAGGRAPYTFTWDDDPVNSNLRASLSAGDFALTITDSEGCSAGNSVVLKQPELPLTAEIENTHLKCFGDEDAEILISAIGGTYPYSYSFNGGSDFQNQHLSQDHAAGNYNIVVKDNNGCEFEYQTIIEQPDSLELILVKKEDILCNGDSTGSILVDAAGGTGVYSYALEGHIFGEVNMFENLQAHEYLIQLTDENNCKNEMTVTLEQPEALQLEFIATPVICKGEANGLIEISSAGGVGGYNYFIDEINFEQNIVDSLSAGEYHLRLVDGNQCNLDTAFTIYEPELALKAEVENLQHVSCYGLSDGAFDLLASGGYGSYTYKIEDTFNSLFSYKELAAESYRVQVKDSMGCEVSVSQMISQPDTLLLSVSAFEDLKCHNDSSGYIELNASGGTRFYYFSLDSLNYKTDSSFAKLAAGQYDFVVKDSNGCIATTEKKLTEPEPVVASVINVVNAACGQANGAAEIDANGGTGSFHYSWVNWNDEIIGTEAFKTDLYAGRYEMSITDENNCKTDISHTIIDNEAPELKVLSVDSVSCFGGTDGSAIVYAEGGAGGFTYSWSDSLQQSDSVAVNLKSSNYTVRVQDQRNCVTSLDLFVPSPDLLQIDLDSMLLPLCFGDANGEIKVKASGGSGSYNYLWNGFSSENTSKLDSLASGEYHVEVKDAKGCGATKDIVLPDPEKLVFDSIITVNPTCYSLKDGAIEVIGSGGTGDLKIQWKDYSASTFLLKGLADGQYFPTIFDQNNCSIKDTVTLTEPSLLVLDTLATADASCSYSNDGEIFLGALGGTGDYTFVWKEFENHSLSSKADLHQGKYRITVSDDHGCSDSLEIIIDAPDTLYAELISSKDPLCYQSCDGSIEVWGMGGTGDYSFVWDTGDTLSKIDNLCEGEYIVEIKDENSCKSHLTSDLVNPAPVDILLKDKIDASCLENCDGLIEVEGTGGTGAYTYSWKNLEANSSKAMDLCAGEYTVEVSDSHECGVEKSYNINEPEKLLINLKSAIEPLCHESAEGSLTVTATGGNGGYTYNWPGLENKVSEASGLTKGEYLVEVLDSLNCFADSTFSLNAPSLLQVDVLATVKPECSGDCSGKIEVFAFGGTAPYKYDWQKDIDNNEGVATGLCADIYNIFISDAHNCVSEKEVILNGPEGISMTIIEKVAPSCATSCDGEIEIIASGGTAPYTYEWVGIEVEGKHVTNLCAGTYTARITDAVGCVFLQQVLLEAPKPLQLEIAQITSPSCYGFSDGSATIDITGGTSPYTMFWNDSDNQSGLNLENVPAGNYSVDVLDYNGCVQSMDIIIEETPEIVIDLGGERTLCLDQTAVLDPGIDSLIYEWSSNNGFSSTERTVELNEAGLYYLKGLSPKGCVVQDTFKINISEETFDVNFLGASELIIGDTLLLTEVCYPAPDYIEWEFSEEPFIVEPTENQPQIVYTAPGNYSITLTAYRGECYDTKTKVTTWYNPSEAPDLNGRIQLGEVGIKDVRLHPNPTDGKLFLDVTLHQMEPLAIFIYDNNGKEVQRVTKDKAIFYRFDFNISNERNGIYHLKVVSNNDVRGIKIIKNK